MSRAALCLMFVGSAIVAHYLDGYDRFDLCMGFIFGVVFSGCVSTRRK